jgi:hypothetical protein
VTFHKVIGKIKRTSITTTFPKVICEMGIEAFQRGIDVSNAA